MKRNITLKTFKSILKTGENYKTEFKLNADKTLNKEIVAFANSSGGKIYIGITDEGKIKGINITNRLKSQIQDIANKCDPKVLISFQEIKKQKVLIIEVKKSKNKPHRCTSGFYIRSGASSQKLNTTEIRIFMEKEGLIEFDRITCKEFDYKKHFDKEKLFKFLDKAKITYNKKNIISLLENLKVTKKQGQKLIFNNAGALFFSKNLEDIYSHTKISCARLKGTEKRYVLDRKIFNKDILSNIDEALLFLQNHLRLKYDIVPGEIQRREFLEIPQEALREALVNAVTHRDYLNQGIYVDIEIYDDRVEISNFGGLPKGLKRNQFGKKSVPRNYLIAELMLRVGNIEKMGIGIKKMRDLVKEAGLKPIKFEFSNFTTLIFDRKPLSSENFISEDIFGMKFGMNFSLNFGVKGRKKENLLKLLSFIDKGENFSSVSFAKKEGITLRTIENYLKFLKNHNLIYFEGPRKTGRYKVTEKYKKFKSDILSKTSRV